MKAQPPDLTRQLLTFREAASVLGMDRIVLGRQVREGTFACMAAVVDVSGRKKISLPALQRWLAGDDPNRKGLAS